MFAPGVSQRVASVAPFFVLALNVAAPAASHDPKIDYMLQCQGCHLADGSGAPESVPALKDEVGKFLLVPRGREYLSRVPGSALSPLSDARLAEVLNWIIRAFGPESIALDFVPFTSDEVARFRKAPLVEVEPMRRELLGQIGRLEMQGGRP